jgi:hypothetical protein
MKRMFLVVAACTPSAPSTPSFQLDVMPILAANCVRCHGYPTIGGAPDTFRLDTFGDVTIRDGTPLPCGMPSADPASAIVICGASSYHGLVALRTGGVGNPMPPRFPLDDFQSETLANWSGERGVPRADNHIPDVAVTPVLGGLRVRVDDADGDLVVGDVRVRVGTTEPLVGVVRSGSVDLAMPNVAAGSYPLLARVDDGAAVHTIELGSVEVR